MGTGPSQRGLGHDEWDDPHYTGTFGNADAGTGGYYTDTRVDAGGDGGGRNQRRQGGSMRTAAGLLGVVAVLVGVVWFLGRVGSPADTAGSAQSEQGDNGDARADNDSALAAGTSPDSANGQATPAASGDSAASSLNVDGSGTTSPGTETTASAARAAPVGAVVDTPYGGVLAYLSADRVILVDLGPQGAGGIAAVPIESSGSILPLDDFVHLFDGKRTIGVGPVRPPSPSPQTGNDTPPANTDGAADQPEAPLANPLQQLRAFLVASSAQMVPSASRWADFWLIAPGPDGENRLNVWEVEGYATPGPPVPPGAEITPTVDPGVVVVHPGAGSFRPTLHSFEKISDHRVVAAAPGVQIEQRCDDQLVCRLLQVNTETGDTQMIPERFYEEPAAISISPDGQWLLNDTRPARIHNLETGLWREIQLQADGQAHWVPPSPALTDHCQLAQAIQGEQAGSLPATASSPREPQALAWIAHGEVSELLIACLYPSGSADPADPTADNTSRVNRTNPIRIHTVATVAPAANPGTSFAILDYSRIGGRPLL